MAIDEVPRCMCESHTGRRRCTMRASAFSLFGLLTHCRCTFEEFTICQGQVYKCPGGTLAELPFAVQQKTLAFSHNLYAFVLDTQASLPAHAAYHVHPVDVHVLRQKQSFKAEGCTSLRPLTYVQDT